jgi:hypothetical protein
MKSKEKYSNSNSTNTAPAAIMPFLNTGTGFAILCFYNSITHKTASSGNSNCEITMIIEGALNLL